MGLYTLKDNNDISYKYTCIIMVDPAMGMLDIEEIPTLVDVNTKVLLTMSLRYLYNKQTSL